MIIIVGISIITIIIFNGNNYNNDNNENNKPALIVTTKALSNNIKNKKKHTVDWQ